MMDLPSKLYSHLITFAPPGMIGSVLSLVQCFASQMIMDSSEHDTAVSLEGEKEALIILLWCPLRKEASPELVSNTDTEDIVEQRISVDRLVLIVTEEALPPKWVAGEQRNLLYRFKGTSRTDTSPVYV